MSARDVVHDLRTLAALTSTPEGAQRLAWGPVWREARTWFAERARELGVEGRTDAAGNTWYTLPGSTPETVILGGHLDSVPNGGWLDGTLGVMAGLGALRMFKDRPRAVGITVVDWADEEGARFGRSLLGSSAASGSLNVEDVRGLVDKQGTSLPDALRDNGVDLDRMLEAHDELKKLRVRGYLELHIEQGPVTRVDEQVDRRRARDLRGRAPHAALYRPGRAFGLDADPDAAGRFHCRGRDRARVP